MTKLFKTHEVVSFLANLECNQTADHIYNSSEDADFVDSKLLENNLIPIIYERLCKTVPQYTYKEEKSIFKNLFLWKQR